MSELHDPSIETRPPGSTRSKAVEATKKPSSVVPLRPRPCHCGLGVSSYERVASLIVALLVLVGLAVALLFMLWLTIPSFSSTEPTVVNLVEGDGGRDLPALTELATDTKTLVREVEFKEPEFQDTLATITKAVASKATLLEQSTLSDQVGSESTGPAGDNRSPRSGPGPPGERRHWEVTFFGGNTSRTYARQLDIFKIELGVLQPKNRVEYVRNLSKDEPNRRAGPADQERRYYLTWQKGELRKADLELVTKAGINAGSRPILKFLPPELEAELARLEQQHAGKRKRQIRATYFAIRPKGDGYEFYVRNQTYRY